MTIHCANCETLIDEPDTARPEDRRLCPNCGSTSRVFKKNVEGTLSFHDSLKMKLQDAVTGKTTLEQLTGDDLSVASGKWMKKERVIDHERDHYKEIVTDPETGRSCTIVITLSASTPTTAPRRK